MIVRGINMGLLPKIIDLIPKAIFWKDTNSVFLGCNKLFADLAGLENSSLIEGKTDFDLPWGKELGETFIKEDIELLKSGKTHIRTILNVEHLNLNFVWTEYTKMPLKDENGEICGILCICEDITEKEIIRSKLSYSEGRYAKLLQSIMDGFVVTDNQGKIVECNRTFEEMTGYSFNELSEMTFFELTPSKWHSIETEILASQTLVRGFSDLYEKEYIRKDGSIISVELRTYLVADENDSFMGYWGIVRDITKKKETEENLAKLEKYYATMFNEHPVPMTLTRYDNGCIVDLNESMIKLLGGQNKNQFIGHTTVEMGILKPGERDEIISRGRNLNGLTISTAVLRRQDNLNVHVEVSWSIYNFGGQEYLLSSVIDISEKMKTEEALFKSEALFRGTFENAGIGIAILDADGRFIRTNKALQKILGYGERELLGNCFIEFTHQQDREQNLILFQGVIALRKKSFQMEKRYVRKDGSERWVLVTYSTVIDSSDNFLYAISLVEDITEKKKAQIELDRYKIHLEALVKERTRNLEKVNMRLYEELEKSAANEKIVKTALEKEKSLNDLKTNFISITSHEFRTPLTSVFTSTQLLDRYRKELNEEEFEAQTFKIKKAVKYLTQLLEDILTFNKADSGKLKFFPSRIDFKKTCQSNIEATVSILKEGQSIKLDYLLKNDLQFLDEKLITFILSNLLSNASKYSGAGMEIFLRIEKEEDSIKITVTDNGIGIPEENRENLFEPFSRGSNVGKISGSGLGLSIVKKAVELHNGTISIDSVISKGTSIFIKIPAIA